MSGDPRGGNGAAGSASATWRATVLTLYPEMFPGPLAGALAGRALENRIWSLERLNIREHAHDKHGSVDDQPFGGGPGMVMRPDVLAAAIDAAVAGGSAAPVIYLTPRGVPLSQPRAREIAAGEGATIICGRFEGKDVPAVLLSGDHERIRSWRRAVAEKITRERRADLWAGMHLRSANTRAKP